MQKKVIPVPDYNPKDVAFGIFDGEANVPESFEIEGIRFKRTCLACPEQYDAYFGATLVAYIRLRYGRFKVYSPNLEDGELIYTAKFANVKGQFKDNAEREIYMTRAAHNIRHYIGRTLQKSAKNLAKNRNKKRMSPRFYIGG